jgi:hypothetical protein
MSSSKTLGSSLRVLLLQINRVLPGIEPGGNPAHLVGGSGKRSIKGNIIAVRLQRKSLSVTRYQNTSTRFDFGSGR